MPTYEYCCTKCNFKFEKFQNITEKPLTRCPKCKGKVKRLISLGAGFIFKGSGFYATDYRKKENKQAAKTEEVKPKESSRKKENIPRNARD